MSELTINDDITTEGLGARLRAARVERGLSVRGLARTIGCSASLLSQIELARTAPSVGILYRLASELEVSTDELLSAGPFGEDATDDDTPIAASDATAAPTPSYNRFESLRALPPSAQAQVQRKEHRRAIDFDHGVRWERLTTTSDASVNFLEIIYAPGATSDHGDHTSGHEGLEYGVVTSGELTATVGEDSYQLRPGDSISFSAAMPHNFRNAGETPARAIWFVISR